MLFLGQSEVDITKPLWSKKTGVFKRWQLRQTFFCNEDTSIRANVVSLKQAACYIETFSSLLTTAQEILPGAINSYKLNKAGINVDIVLSSRHIGQRAVSNRCSWKQHRSPPSNKPERSWDSEQPTFIQCISAYTAGLTLKYTLCYSNFTHTHTPPRLLLESRTRIQKHTTPASRSVLLSGDKQQGTKKINMQAPLSLQKAPRFEENNTLREMWHRKQQNKNTISH